MSTLTTRVGGWPLVIVRDDDGALLAHIDSNRSSGQPVFPPKPLRSIRVQPDGQVSTIVSAFVSDVTDWQDAEVFDAQAHYAAHVGTVADVVAFLRRFGIVVDGQESSRRLLNECNRCGYWHRVMLQRLGNRTRFADKVPPTPAIPEADDDLRVAVFYKGSRVREMGVPYWSDPDPEGRQIMLVHVEAYAPWGEVLCATAPVSEVRLHPFHEVKS
jgi:hypothetical protein